MRVKIYTKTGDAGETGLFGGGRVPKDHRRVEAYGEVDELNAAIGLARALEPSGFGDGLLQSIQRDLFTIGAELATPDRDKLPKALARSGAPLGESDVAALEDALDTHEAKLANLNNFILTVGSPQADALHLARTHCRSAVRAVGAGSHEDTSEPTGATNLHRMNNKTCSR